jgi:hypothetical protein
MFVDLSGPPKSKCKEVRYEGDPSIDAYVAGASTCFYRDRKVRRDSLSDISLRLINN